jgi:putative addiction module component (TIGR02574 family)
MPSILKLPIEDRIRLVEDICDSIADDQSALDLSRAQKRAELDKRLDAYEKDGEIGREASEVITEIRSTL